MPAVDFPEGCMGGDILNRLLTGVDVEGPRMWLVAGKASIFKFKGVPIYFMDQNRICVEAEGSEGLTSYSPPWILPSKGRTKRALSVWIESTLSGR